MTQWTKRLERLRAHPVGNHFEEIASLLHHFEFTSRQRGRGSSHYLFEHQRYPDIQVVIARSRPVKAVYAKAAVRAIEAALLRDEVHHEG
ncbi:MAG: hypothetical protein HY335_05760 [Deinococcus sp.]|nr:hypothetical protein [Deinococcus sp.]